MKATWPTKKLREICEEIISGDWGTEREKTGSVLCKVIRGTDFILVQKGKLSELPDRYIDIEKFEKIKLKPGDILVEISGGSKDQPTGRILFWDRNEIIPIAFSNFVKKILLNTEIVEPKFFFRYWQFLYFKGITKNYEDRTTNIRNFKLKEFLENEEIPLPPLLIQQKIVKILDTIQEAIDIQEKIIEKTKELKKSLMAELFKYGAPSFRKGRKLKKTEIGEIPEDWEVVRLGEVTADMINGFPIGERDYKGILQLRMDSITTEGKININAGVKVPRIKGIENYLLQNGDILFNNTNSIDLVGKTAIFKGEFSECVFSNHLTRIRVNLTRALSEWVFYTLFRYWELKIFKNLGTRRVGQADITTNILKNIKIPLPPLLEQQEIAEILQTIDQKIEIEKRKKELYEELFKTMLNKIMNQEIDVEKIEV
jgi:type I restriction enzyme, S subunit